MSRRKGLNFHRKRRVIQTSTIRSVLFWVGECILAFVIGCVLVFYFMTTLSCVGQAMEPTIGSGDQVFVNRFSYTLTGPRQGDVVVFRPNGNVNSHYYMRRVVAVPGDTVQIIEGFVYVNGELYETGIGSEQMDYAGLAEEPVERGDDEYFEMGENGTAGGDSRDPGTGNVKKEEIRGKAWYIASPSEDRGTI